MRGLPECGGVNSCSEQGGGGPLEVIGLRRAQWMVMLKLNYCGSHEFSMSELEIKSSILPCDSSRIMFGPSFGRA